MVLLHIKPTDLHVFGWIWGDHFQLFLLAGWARPWAGCQMRTFFYPGFIRILSGILCMRTWAAKPPNMLGWGWPGLGWLGWLGWVGLGWAGCAGLGWLAGLAGWLAPKSQFYK